jgi:CheY-like chemotaxis protein
MQTQSNPSAGAILLVDDDMLIIEVGRAMIERLGYTVHSAFSGHEAVDIVEKKGSQINLIILDQVMPGMDGIQTLKRIMQIAPHIPVLLSSGYGIDPSMREELRRGFRDAVQKPFTMAELSEKIRTALTP